MDKILIDNKLPDNHKFALHYMYDIEDEYTIVSIKGIFNKRYLLHNFDIPLNPLGHCHLLPVELIDKYFTLSEDCRFKRIIENL
jgi:hypothetical protein